MHLLSFSLLGSGSSISDPVLAISSLVTLGRSSSSASISCSQLESSSSSSSSSSDSHAKFALHRFLPRTWEHWLNKGEGGDQSKKTFQHPKVASFNHSENASTWLNKKPRPLFLYSFFEHILYIFLYGILYIHFSFLLNIQSPEWILKQFLEIGNRWYISHFSRLLTAFSRTAI